MFFIKGRQLEVLIFLLKYKKTTYKQLALHFEVSTKTIERDINRLSIMGVPIYCTQGIGGGVQIDENYKFNSSFFSESDIIQIIFAFKIMDSFSDNINRNSIINKLSLILPELSETVINDSSKYLECDFLENKINIDNELLKKVNIALDNETLLKINNNLYAPISYVLKADDLYLFCFNKKYYLLPCNKILNIESTDISFERNFITYKEFKNNNN